MKAFFIILIVLQGLGIGYKLFYLITSIYREESDQMTKYAFYSIIFSILFEVGFAICLSKFC